MHFILAANNLTSTCRPKVHHLSTPPKPQTKGFIMKKSDKQSSCFRKQATL